MTRLGKALVLVMLSLWVLASVHCALEQVPGLTFLASCHGAQAAQAGNNCDGDSCSVIESGSYIAAECTSTAPLPDWVLSSALPLFEPDAPAVLPHAVAPGSSPPGLSRIWQFTCRSALPPRAPSFVA